MGQPKPRVRTSSCTISPRRFTFSTIRFRGESTPTDVRDELYYECACWTHDGGRLARPSGGGRPPETGFFAPGAYEPRGFSAAVPFRPERARSDREGESPSHPAEPVRRCARDRPDHRRGDLRDPRTPPGRDRRPVRRRADHRDRDHERDPRLRPGVSGGTIARSPEEPRRTEGP